MDNLIDKQQYFKAKQQLQQFLDKHPEMKQLQQKIDKALENAGSIENRLTIISTMMFQSLEQLNQQLNEVKQKLVDFQSDIERQ
jgi:DNA repair exonuclease SbcCD ATPase subunit